MSLTTLKPGDRCSRISENGSGLRLRYVVDDSLQLPKSRGEALMIPVVRDITHKPKIRAEGWRPPTVRWINRKELRKLPTRNHT